ncbi:MAG TPA: CAP domain-containing protein [Thermoanaerobaculia bacterium]|nr:CAP domain-containing protein [Thermoanaerobaculia bacterium]
MPISTARSTPGLSALVLGAVLAAAPDEYQATRETFLEQINAVRAAAAAKALRLSTVLSAAAQGLAEEAAAGHDAGGSPAEEGARRAAKSGYGTRIISEVTAEADGDVASVVAAWRDGGGTPAAEIVGRDYREMGLGVAIRNDRPLYVLLLGLSWKEYFHEQTDPLKNLEGMREQMLARVNRERTSRAIAPLRRHPRLDEAAQAHADDMFARRYYSHDTPEGRTAIDREQAKGYRAKYAGENIARGQYSIDEVMDGWMQSKTHRDHLLSPTFNDVGFGLAFGKNPGGYEILWVQNFGRPKGRERL